MAYVCVPRACVFGQLSAKWAALVGVRACLSGSLQNVCFFYSYRVTLTLFTSYECFACGIYHLYVICECQCGQRRDALAFRQQGQVPQPVSYVP